MKFETLRAKHLEYEDRRPSDRKLIVFRLGGFGDQLMATSVFPALVKRGWSIEFWCGREHSRVVLHDPHIDTLVPVPFGAITDEGMGAIIRGAMGAGDGVLQLSECCEATFLTIPERTTFYWPLAMRRKHFGQAGYLSVIAGLAEVPMDEVYERFYPTADERAQIDAVFGAKPSMVVSLSGSGCHKWWPGMPQFLKAAAERFPYLHIWTVGDDTKVKPPEHPRIHAMSKVWSLRQAFTAATLADVVLGNETGLLHAVGSMDVAKILLLSHSSRQNIGDEWVNCIQVEASQDKAPCHPCHRHHRTADFCSIAKSGAALCQESISVDQVLTALDQSLTLKKEAA